MPIPTPREGETQPEYHHRCMADATMNREYPDAKQRNAICFREWDAQTGQQSRSFLPLDASALDSPPCFRAHLGIWAIEPLWMRQALDAIKAQMWPLTSMEALTRDPGNLYASTEDGVAVIRITGQITKGPSKFGGTSTVLTKLAIRRAIQSEDIQSILLAIDSPGGQVDGVQDLADEVARARQFKPVDAYIEDLGASAAYWIASQARHITASPTTFIGSIGAFAVLEDLSGLAAREGITVRVVSTGPYKGMGAPGTPITQDHVDEVQKQVNQIGAFFFASVQGGRRLSPGQLAAVTDGRLWIAAEARQRHLIDEVGTFERAVTMALSKRPVRHMAARANLARLRAALTMEGTNHASEG